MEKLKKIYADSEDQLFSILKLIEVKMPARTKGRKTEHTEIWSICHMLSTYSENNFLQYPIALENRDKPDFQLQLNTNDIGIEFTEAIPEQYAWALVLRDKYFPNSNITPSLFRWGSPKRSRKEILRILKASKNKLIGPPLVGDSVEMEWSVGMWDCIVSKLDKLNKKRFKKYYSNWLLIYDNLPSTLLNFSKASDYLNEKLIHYWDGFPGYEYTFDHILIECRKNFLIINSKGTKFLKTCNIW
ncbi:MAG: hypothetical protein HQ534_03955 [Armatimonadetes bacterium]|nr:hypothetical protein [Armatimonadota bacterium]